MWKFLGFALILLAFVGDSKAKQTKRIFERLSAYHARDPVSFYGIQEDEQQPPTGPWEVGYFDSYIDHFGFRTDTYLYNTTFYQKGGPLFFYTGNEGSIELFAQNTKILYELAPLFNAAVVFVEHRYYGFKQQSSMPYGKDSFSHIEKVGFLTTQQALADFAVITPFLKKTLNLTAEAPVIAFGGSYGGMLAAWFKIKYPNLVTGAWAASAPLIQFRKGGLAPDAFGASIKKTFLDAGCKDAAIVGAENAIIKMAQIDASKLRQPENVSALLDYVTDALFYLPMTDYPYPTNFIQPLPLWPVREACQYLDYVNETDEGLVTNLAKAIDVFYNSSGQLSDGRCIMGNCENKGMGNLADIDIAWGFQSCTELALYLCGSGPPNDFFFPSCNASTFSQQFIDSCFEAMNTQFPGFRKENTQLDYVWRYYGTQFNGTSNIIFTNGQLDPWSVGGVSNTTMGIFNGGLERNLFVYTIAGAAHHLDLRQPNTCDPPPVIEARYQIVQILKCWTGQAGPESCSPSNLQKPLPDFKLPTLEDLYTNPTKPDCVEIFGAYPWKKEDKPSASNTNQIFNIALLLSTLTSIYLSVFTYP